MSKPANRIIVGISGASGIVYGVRMLEALKKAGVETHLVVSKAAEMTLAYETGLSRPRTCANWRTSIIRRATSARRSRRARSRRSAWSSRRAPSAP